MILIPLIVAQIIVANAFFGNHWSRVHDTLARTLAGEISTMINFIDTQDTNVLNKMAHEIGINVSTNKKLNRPKRNDNILTSKIKFVKCLKALFLKFYKI